MIHAISAQQESSSTIAGQKDHQKPAQPSHTSQLATSDPLICCKAVLRGAENALKTVRTWAGFDVKFPTAEPAEAVNDDRRNLFCLRF